MDVESVGTARVAAQNTNHTSSQVIGWNAGWPNSDIITQVVDAGDIKSTTGWLGGPLPNHSLHWGDYFREAIGLSPTGKDQIFIAKPDPTMLAGLAQHDQQAVTGNSYNVWNWFSGNFIPSWRKGAPPSTYKHTTP